jgi:hypothetical protein
MALIAFTGSSTESSTERRQLSAVKKELDQEYEAQISKGPAQTKYPAVLRLDPRWWLQLCETLCCAFKQVTQVDCFETSY